MITLNNINNIFKDIADRHLQIHEFFIGQDYDIAASRKMNHVLLAINPTSAILSKTDNGYTTNTIEYTLKVIDLVSKDLSNQQEVFSDTLSIIKDVVIMLNQHPDYYEMNLNIIGDVSLSTLDGVFDTDVTGWETNITIETPLALSYCETPIT